MKYEILLTRISDISLLKKIRYGKGTAAFPVINFERKKINIAYG